MGDSRACLPTDHNDLVEGKETSDDNPGEVICQSSILGKLRRNGIQNTHEGLGFHNRRETLAVVV